MAARGEGGRQGSRGAWGKACARVGAIHGVGGGGVRRRRAAGAVGCHPEVVRPARRRRGGSCGSREAGARRRGGGVAAGDGAMASRDVVLCVCLMSVY